MLDQLKRLVSGGGSANNNGQMDGIPPSGNARQSRNQGQPSAASRSGSLSRLTAYALHPQHSGRMRMQLSYSVVPLPYAPPVVAYGRNGRPAVVGYDPWYQMRYQQQQPSAHHLAPPPRTPVGRQLSARPDLAITSAGKKKSEKECKDVFHHPTVRRDTVLPHGRNRLVSSRSLDSIHPHRIHPPKMNSEVVEVKSSTKKVKDFFQRVKDTVTNGGGSSQTNNKSGQGQKTDEWLLLRPSVVVSNNSSKVAPSMPQRPTTPGLAAFRKIFSRSPSPVATSTPVKRQLTSTKSLFHQIIRPRSRSISSTASLSVRSHSNHSGAAVTDLNKPNGPTLRGNPDGATFPRDTPYPPMQLTTEIYAPASEPARPTTTSKVLPNKNQFDPGPKRPSKFVKKLDQQQPAFRVKRRQSQLRRSERKRRSSRRRSSRNKTNRSSKKLGSSKSSLLGSQSALSGAKLVSDWTYLPLPAALAPNAGTEEESAPPPQEEEEEAKEPDKVVLPIQNEDDGWESDLYQVLVDRPRRALPPPMWDPLIFIPPERRRNSATINGILVDHQPWIRSSKLRADGKKKQLRRINPPLSPSSSRSASSSGKHSHASCNHYTLHLAIQSLNSCVSACLSFCECFVCVCWRCVTRESFSTHARVYIYISFMNFFLTMLPSGNVGTFSDIITFRHSTTVFFLFLI